MNFEIIMAWRFLKSARTQTILILAGIIVGVSVQIFLASLINGLQAELVNTTIGNSPHIYIFAQEIEPTPLKEMDGERLVISKKTYFQQENDIFLWRQGVQSLKGIKDVTAISPVVNGPAFSQRGQINRSVLIRGVLAEEANKIYRLDEKLIGGREELSGNKIMIGKDLAQDLDVRYGDILQLSTSRGSSTFIIAGIFDFKNQSINSSWVFMDLYRAQTFLEMSGKISQIEVQINEVFNSQEIAESIRARISNYQVETWQDRNQQLLSGLRSQSSSSLIIQVFVLFSITLGIASVLVVSAVQKSKQIGILKAIGAKKYVISRVFFWQGAFLGLVGSSIGSILGIILIRSFTYFARVGDGIELFEINIQPGIILGTMTITILASTIAAIIPALKAASLSPIEVIRNG